MQQDFILPLNPYKSMSYNQNQFVVVQHDIQLTPEQLLVYVIIKKGMDGTSHISYVNIGTIMAVSNFNKSTILKYLEVIEEKGYFKIVKCGANLHYNSYVFPQEHRDEKFERFAFEMIERPDLTPTEKAYLIALQKHLFIDFESGVGRVSYSDLELCQKIQGSRKKLMEVMKSLKEKGIITAETEIFKRDKETGLRVRQRDFILNNYNTAKWIINLAFHKTIPKRANKYILNSLIRISKDNAYIRSLENEIKNLKSSHAINLNIKERNDKNGND